MKRLIAVLGFTALSFGQVPSVVNTGPRILPPQNAYPYGNILFPGGTGTTGSHATNLGNTVSGVFTRPPGGQPGRGTGAGRARTIVVPYAVPIYTDPGYYAPQQQAPNVTVVVPPPTTPTVVINQNYLPETANPAMRIYSDDEQPIEPDAGSSVKIYRAPVAPRPEGRPIPNPAASSRDRVIDEKPTIYLIALKDASVHSAIGYWANKGDLMFVSPSGQITRVPLEQLDRKTTEQLNSERKVDIDLTTLQ